MCDVSYALLVERMTAQVLADRQVVAIYLAAGGKGVEMPDLDAALTRLDELLVAEPQRLEPNELVLREALGLNRAG